MGLKALDLFCGGGGAALGLQQAGYDVYGVDINPRHHRVYPGRFVHGDALNPPFDLGDFDLVWASPPCQRFSQGTRISGTPSRHPDRIGATRSLLSGHPRTVIENVPGAPIRADLVLTGPAVDLPQILRRRHFELSWWPGLIAAQPFKPTDLVVSITTHTRQTRMWDWANATYYTADEAAKMMGIDIPMTGAQLGEAVPPAYAKFIGELASV